MSPDEPPDSTTAAPAHNEGAFPKPNLEEVDGLRDRFLRTPRPYLISQRKDERDRDEESEESHEREWNRCSVAQSSESGTEADDERPGNFIKALPPSTTRLRKGLKTGEEQDDALFTPSQLDETEYFSQQAEEREQEQRRVQRRRYGEFFRRSSEVALMGVILLCVLCGDDVARNVWACKRELLAYLITIAGLVVAYPIKLSIVDTQATHHRIWERFRVPASFDPATVLYPPLLPVLVSLSVAPRNHDMLMLNIMLGLASLPQRLFPRSSRVGKINAVHWLVSMIPLVVSKQKLWFPNPSSETFPSLSAAQVLSPETLVSLYPLHHALLAPLYYLTTTSLLITELHLLSAGLLNLLLLAESPQSMILKACLWIGGVSLLVSCGPVLHWNVTLARMPRWKLRRPGHTAEERKSLVDAVSDLINLQRAVGAFKSSPHNPDSDADEDAPVKSIKQVLSKATNGMPKINTAGLVMQSLNSRALETNSALEPRNFVHSVFQNGGVSRSTRPRRNTVPEPVAPIDMTDKNVKSLRRMSSRKKRPSNLHWCLQLTPEQATRRKWFYAGSTYLAIVAIVLLPVKEYVSRKALRGQEPIAWAIGYLFGQIPLIRSTIFTLGIQEWIPLPSPAANWENIGLNFPLDVDLLRNSFGRANIRLLLIVYWVFVLIAGLLAVFSLTSFVEVDTRRKVFHGVMVAMFVPTVFIDPCYCALALSLVLVIFLILEVIRAGQIPPLGNAIGRFVAPYVDGRDLRGPVVISHIFLLVGCAVPLWFSLASILRDSEGWELANKKRETAMITGVVCVGMGDAAASLIGRRYGRHKWIWVGGKSIEGSAAFAIAVTIGLLAAKLWQDVGGWTKQHRPITTSEIVADWMIAFAKALSCASGASFMEAVLTGANDNVVVPIALWLLVKGLRL